MAPLDAIIEEELIKAGTREKAEVLSRFFKTGKGAYGEGDIFLGITVPAQRILAKKYAKEASLDTVAALLDRPYHECRMTALLILIMMNKDSAMQQKIMELYRAKIDRINNWDLIDLSAPSIPGQYYYQRSRADLFELVNSGELWQIRIGIMSTFYFIKKFDFDDTLRMSELLLSHPHDLIQKAVGWMLREIGKRDLQKELDFLKDRYTAMPRTMLRYAIEKFPEETRLSILKGSW